MRVIYIPTLVYQKYNIIICLFIIRSFYDKCNDCIGYFIFWGYTGNLRDIYLIIRPKITASIYYGWGAHALQLGVWLFAHTHKLCALASSRHWRGKFSSGQGPSLWSWTNVAEIVKFVISWKLIAMI